MTKADSKFLRLLCKADKSFQEYFPHIFFPISVAIIILGLFDFFLFGFHAVDLSNNYDKIFCDWEMYAEQNNLTWVNPYVETRISGEYIQLDDLYNEGVYHLFTGLSTTFFGGFLFGLALMSSGGKRCR